MQSNIKKVSCFFRILFQIVFVALPLMHIIAWINAPAPISLFGSLLGANSEFVIRIIPEGVKILHTLSSSTKFFGFLVSAIPLIVVEFIFYYLIKLFRLYEKSEIFSQKNVGYIKKTGYALLIAQLAKPICEGFLSAILTWQNPHGYRYAEVSLGGLNLAMVLVAFLIILISWIMAEGCRLREEQQLTI